MTQQFPDTVTFRRARYSITAVEGAGLCDPGAFELSPRGWSSACWGGVICHYAVAAGRLGLRRLEIGLENPPPPLEGVLPSPHRVPSKKRGGSSSGDWVCVCVSQWYRLSACSLTLTLRALPTRTLGR